MAYVHTTHTSESIKIRRRRRKKKRGRREEEEEEEEDKEEEEDEEEEEKEEEQERETQTKSKQLENSCCTRIARSGTKVCFERLISGDSLTSQKGKELSDDGGQSLKYIPKF